MASAATGQTERAEAASELNTDDPAVIARAFPFPKIDPANELKGRALLDALRKGGFVLYMRHTQTGSVTPECTASNLTPAGERDARNVGAALRNIRIPIDRVLSSPVCRVRDTANLLGIGNVEFTEDLGNMPSARVQDLERARVAQLAALPEIGKNRLLVSHMQRGKAASDRLDLDFGEVIVFQAGAVERKAVARVRVAQWSSLAELGAANDGARIP